MNEYFAFGANLCRSVFVERRGMTPEAARVAVLHDHALVFDVPGIPVIEPAFASVRPAPGERVWGVLWRIGDDDARRLDHIESEPYVRVDVEVHTDGGLVTAFTYANRLPVGGLRPSRRYRDLLVAGAREWDLPEDWCERIAGEDAAHVPVLSSMVGPSMRLLEAAHRWRLLPWEWFRPTS